ncbi:MAG TPA: hypothetical protein QGF58_09960 [Myxococcota bacterium]|nr:hypothetical protein [Myxococcota bacterium]
MTEVSDEARLQELFRRQAWSELVEQAAELLEAQPSSALARGLLRHGERELERRRRALRARWDVAVATEDWERALDVAEKAGWTSLADKARDRLG